MNKKSILNKIRLFLGLGMVCLLPVVVNAAGTPQFNNIVGDKEFLQGWNITKGSTTLSDPVQAEAGQTVGVAMYYHNTVVGSTATNTILKISIPTASALTHVLTGTISADGVSPVSGTIVNGTEVGAPNFTINSSTNTQVAFVPGSVRWYPDEMATTGLGAGLPNGQNGDTLVTTGLNIGSINGCFQYSGSVYFNVILSGIPPKIEISKNVRKAGTNDSFVDSIIANPGTNEEYQITVRNVDGASTVNGVNIKDVLPNGISYVGPTVIHYSDGTTQNLPDGIISASGITLPKPLSPSETVNITYLASSSASLSNNTCLVNTATASSLSTTGSVSDSAKVCFIVPTPTPTPTPTATPPIIPTPTPIIPTPTPVVNTVPVQSTLPRTGPGMDLFLSLGVSGLGVGSGYFYNLKRKIKKIRRKIDIL